MRKNEDVIKSFMMGYEDNNLNVRSTGDKLYSYTTCIAQWINHPRLIILNKTKYSVTTSRHQGILKRYITPDLEVMGIYAVPIGTKDIYKYCIFASE